MNVFSIKYLFPSLQNPLHTTNPTPNHVHQHPDPRRTLHANLSQAAESAPNIPKHFCVADQANATCRLVNDVHLQVPSLADGARRMIESAVERNQAQRVAAETMNAYTDTAGAFERAAESVGRSAEM